MSNTRHRVIAICILMERYLRCNFNLKEAVPDWWNIDPKISGEHYIRELNEDNKRYVLSAFSSRSEALSAFLRDLGPLVGESIDRIRSEVEMEYPV
ncbi:hypothetical protein LEP1GSC047_4238 [Leptospira inadai serovar Lyme str. 10]|uniref:Uncharacterized protein n=2 Tax=Leptospira inadai serovar Lyme TaxID=293084 RepID=V6HLV9_9LEPT|nr:hypothetical protein [Leptospira inadai]EQA37855.1 hypothetical protein LEP1GSC047_4238 [Leptospira inadai serovar Lyme str. 10]PNV73317.1 hypothetical protein BES34_017645 [Leptospira inadai serovar Lyme]